MIRICAMILGSALLLASNAEAGPCKTQRVYVLSLQLGAAPDASSRMAVLSELSGELADLSIDEIDSLDPAVSTAVARVISPLDGGLLVWTATVLSQLGPNSLPQVDRLQTALEAYRDPSPPPDAVATSNIDVREDVMDSIARIRASADRKSRGLRWDRYRFGSD